MVLGGNGVYIYVDTESNYNFKCERRIFRRRREENRKKQLKYL